MKFKELLGELTAQRRSRPNFAEMSPWERSAVLAGKIVRTGPDVSRKKAEEVVEVLREQSALASTMIGDIAKLEPAPSHRATYGDTLAGISVVDRANWAMWAARGIGEIIGVTTTEPVEDEPEPSDLNSTVEMTAVLTFLSQRTLGQFIPFTDDSVASSATAALRPGHLVLVAPNILATQRAMAVDLKDFALWIALHEHTHALQFATAPWLTNYMREQSDRLIRGFDSEASLIKWVRGIAATLRGQTSVIEYFLSEEQNAHLDNITALMSVLEGHADVIMDRVPREHLQSKRVLRRKLNARRVTLTRSKELLGRVAGIEAKTQQYLVGAQFVRSVISASSLERFNRVFDGPEFLPTVPELGDAAAWLKRTDALLGINAEDTSPEDVSEETSAQGAE